MAYVSYGLALDWRGPIRGCIWGSGGTFIEEHTISSVQSSCTQGARDAGGFAMLLS